VRGSQGHAGTVPMAMRKDPMIAAAQSIVAIENICTHPEKGVGGSRGASQMSSAVNYAGAIVCTVGEIHSWPGASNVIPGEVLTHIPRCLIGGCTAFNLELVDVKGCLVYSNEMIAHKSNGCESILPNSSGVDHGFLLTKSGDVYHRRTSEG